MRVTSEDPNSTTQKNKVKKSTTEKNCHDLTFVDLLSEQVGK